MAKKILIILIIILSCKPSGKIVELNTDNAVEKVNDTTSTPRIEMSAGPDIKIEDAELRDFKEFMVWVTTKNMDTIGNCRLKKVSRIKGLDTLPHFFVKFQTLPIVYKMRIENSELVFAKINKSGTN